MACGGKIRRRSLKWGTVRRLKADSFLEKDLKHLREDCEELLNLYELKALLVFA